jgi:hypothetical protein
MRPWQLIDTRCADHARAHRGCHNHPASGRIATVGAVGNGLKPKTLLQGLPAADEAGAALDAAAS